MSGCACSMRRWRPNASLTSTRSTTGAISASIIGWTILWKPSAAPSAEEERVMSNIDPALAYARKNREQAVEDLRALIRIPSISMTPQNQPDVLRGAEWVAQRLQSLGVEDVQIMPTAGHPVVYGHWRGAGKAPTILVYGHYDVQPVDPLELWKSDA